ncbi:uncharacterized protein [Prorops nasuta]|uniref:uncharacterized protein n=1 Tax=Prorops nasuta TaxID=863751 RepID=UPI0034CD057F
MADEFTREKLLQWNLEDLIPIFSENEINECNLKQLNLNLIKELIPKVGLRLRFIEKWKEISDTTKNQAIEEELEISGDEVLSDKENFNVQRQDCVTNEKDFFVQSLNVETILNKTLKGKGIVKSCKKQKVLTSKTRDIVVDILMPAVLKISKRLTNRDLQVLAQKIVNAFPSEHVDIYYVPPIKKQDSRTNKSIRYVHTYTLVVSEITESKTWLQNNIGPWELAVHHWKKTLKLRCEDIKNNKEHNVCDIIEKWPILNQLQSYKLILLDFESLNLTNFELTFEKFKKFLSCVQSIKQISKKDDNASSLKDLLTLQDLSEDSQVLVTLLLLPHFLPPRGRCYIAKRHWKPTISECKDSIVNHVTILGDIDHLLKLKRREAMKQLGLTLQPYIIAVGRQLTEIESIFISFDAVLYKTQSMIEAIDTCFKIFNVFNIQYPNESSHIWEVIQVYLYGIKTVFDRHTPFVTEVINDINNQSI